MMNWAIVDDLRGSSSSSSNSRPSARLAKQQHLLDPDSLLDRVDIAIANAEYAHATRHLALHFPPSSPSKPPLHSQNSSTPSAPALALPSDPTLSSQYIAGSLDSALKDVKSLDSTLNCLNLALGSLDSHVDGLHLTFGNVDADGPEANVGCLRSTFGNVDADGPDSNRVIDSRFLDVGTRCTETTQEGHEMTGLENTNPSSDIKNMDLSSSSDGYDPLAADTAYRAARSAISQGNLQLALSLLHVALRKCPPDKDIALGKVQRLIASTLQELENKELSSAPIETST